MHDTPKKHRNEVSFYPLIIIYYSRLFYKGLLQIFFYRNWYSCYALLYPQCSFVSNSFAHHNISGVNKTLKKVTLIHALKPSLIFHKIIFYPRASIPRLSKFKNILKMRKGCWDIFKIYIIFNNCKWKVITIRLGSYVLMNRHDVSYKQKWTFICMIHQKT